MTASFIHFPFSFFFSSGPNSLGSDYRKYGRVNLRPEIVRAWWLRPARLVVQRRRNDAVLQVRNKWESRLPLVTLRNKQYVKKGNDNSRSDVARELLLLFPDSPFFYLELLYDSIMIIGRARRGKRGKKNLSQREATAYYVVWLFKYRVSYHCWRRIWIHKKDRG